MKILIACEYSGVVRESFRMKGHDVWSCDVKDSIIPGNHFKCDVLNVLDLSWDMMIAFPPCTYLSFAGNSFWNDKNRYENRTEAMSFFLSLYFANIPKICIENPVGYPNQYFRKPDQIVHPYYFGESFMKRTCLWLKNLPPLVHSDVNSLFYKKTHVAKPQPISIDRTGRKTKRNWCDSQSFKSGKRNITFKSIAMAMADQWG